MLIALIRVYQWMISPWLPNCCRFEPTCSHYAVRALQLHGFWRGSALTIWRLLRCQPFCRGGVDPVPPSRNTAPQSPPAGEFPVCRPRVPQRKRGSKPFGRQE